MITFLISSFNLLVVLGYALKKDEEFRILLFILCILLAGGTFFFWHVEQWALIDAIYFCVMTMSTIGYGDLVPTSSFSKLFTTVFAILSIGVFAAAVSKVVQIILAYRRDGLGKGSD